MVLPLTKEGAVELQLSTTKHCSAGTGGGVLVGAQDPKGSLPAV